jgi:hypothetical protein
LNQLASTGAEFIVQLSDTLAHCMQTSGKFNR